MRFAVSIVSPPGYPHSEAFREVAQSLHHGLVSLGHDSKLTCRTQAPGRRLIVLGANLLPPTAQLPADTVLYNLEQIEPGSAWLDARRGLVELLRRHTVWDYSEHNVKALAGLGVAQVRHVPIGWVPQLRRIAPADEDLDVLFFGSMNERRAQVLDALERSGVKVARVFGVYGRARDALIARAKVVLNVHFYESKLFELVRCSYLLANRRFVVSESGSDAALEAPFREGLLFRERDGLVEACREHLGRPDERRRIAERGEALMRARPLAPGLAAALG